MPLPVHEAPFTAPDVGLPPGLARGTSLAGTYPAHEVTGDGGGDRAGRPVVEDPGALRLGGGSRAVSGYTGWQQKG